MNLRMIFKDHSVPLFEINFLIDWEWWRKTEEKISQRTPEYRGFGLVDETWRIGKGWNLLPGAASNSVYDPALYHRWKWKRRLRRGTPAGKRTCPRYVSHPSYFPPLYSRFFPYPRFLRIAFPLFSSATLSRPTFPPPFPLERRIASEEGSFSFTRYNCVAQSLCRRKGWNSNWLR